MFGSICARFLSRLATVALCGLGAPVSCAPSAASLRKQADAYVKANAPDWALNGPPRGDFATGRSACRTDTDYDDDHAEGKAQMRAVLAIMEGRCPHTTTRSTTPSGTKTTKTQNASIGRLLTADRFTAPCVTSGGEAGHQAHVLVTWEGLRCE